MTSTSSKATVIAVGLILFAGFAYSSHYYSDSSSITAETGFTIPHYDSQEELLAELVAPFLFLTILLNFVLIRVLNFIVGSKDEYPTGAWPAGIPVKEDRPDVRKYSILMSVTITAMLIPTPFWNYVRWAVASIGLIVMAGFVALVLFIMYLMAGFGGE